MAQVILRHLLLRGGKEVKFQVPGNPVIAHSGNLTPCTLTLREEELETLKLNLSGCGIQVEELDSSQERVVQEELPPRCITCYWLDEDSSCGLKSWPKEVIEEAKKHPDALSAIRKCSCNNG